MKITKKTTKDEIMAMDNLYRHDLKDCHEMLTDDEDVVLKFIRSYWGNFEMASDRLKNDRDFIKRVVQINTVCFLYADDSLRKDIKYIIELIELTNAQIVVYAYHTIAHAVYEHLKQPAIEYFKNELKKEGV